MGLCCSGDSNATKEAGQPLLTGAERDRSTVYYSGDVVMVLQPGTERWCKGTIVGRPSGDGTYDILYDDGDEDRKLSWRRIKGGKSLRKHETSADARMRRMDPRRMPAFDASDDVEINIRDIHRDDGDGRGGGRGTSSRRANNNSLTENIFVDDGQDGFNGGGQAGVDARADTRARLRQASNLRTAGAVAHRQLLVQAPLGSTPGNQMVIATPSGVKMKVVIPPGVGPGETFTVNVQVVPGGAAGAVYEPAPPEPPTHRSLPTSTSPDIQKKLVPPSHRARRAQEAAAIEEGDSSPSHSLESALNSPSFTRQHPRGAHGRGRGGSRTIYQNSAEKLPDGSGQDSSMESIPALDIAAAAIAWRDGQQESSGGPDGPGGPDGADDPRSEHSLDRDWRRQFEAEEAAEGPIDQDGPDPFSDFDYGESPTHSPSRALGAQAIQ